MCMQHRSCQLHHQVQYKTGASTALLIVSSFQEYQARPEHGSSNARSKIRMTMEYRGRGIKERDVGLGVEDDLSPKKGIRQQMNVTYSQDSFSAEMHFFTGMS